MNKNAALNIILAQVASDAGKGIVELYEALPKSMKHVASKALKSGYAAKDELLERACLIVARHKDPDIRFFVSEDAKGIAKFIIYFDIRIDDKKWQASFHSFGKKRWSKWLKSTVPSRGHWDHKSSRNTCKELARFLEKPADPTGR
jgi:hypothetical protein